MIQGMRYVAITSGGCDDFSCHHLLVPAGLDLAGAKDEWRRYYKEYYIRRLGEQFVKSPAFFMSFPEFLVSVFDCRDAEIEEFYDL